MNHRGHSEVGPWGWLLQGLASSFLLASLAQWWEQLYVFVDPCSAVTYMWNMDGNKSSPFESPSILPTSFLF